MADKKGKFYNLVPRGQPELDIISVDSHRNGISGKPFYVVTFDTLEDNKKMVGILFEDNKYCAVFDRELVGAGETRWMYNSWRGDYFEPVLRKAIQWWKDKWEERHEEVMSGLKYRNRQVERAKIGIVDFRALGVSS